MKTTEKILLFSVIAPLFGGCGYATKSYRFQDAALKPREANCPLQVFTAPPKTSAKELGVVEFKPRGLLGNLPATEQEAREKAYGYACLAGGDGILLIPNRNGLYAKVTILSLEKKK